MALVLLVIIGLVLVAYFGIPGPKNGDLSTTLVKGATQTNLGIDIRGGVDITFNPPAGYKATAAELNTVKDILGKRLDDQHITDRSIVVDSTHNHVVVRFPYQTGSFSDPDAAVKALGSTAQLSFKDPSGKVVLTGKDVASAAAAVDQDSTSSSYGSYYVELKLNADGTKKFADATTKNVGKVISIYLDKDEISAPTVQNAITGGNASITGNFTADTAKDLAQKINDGALPFTLTTSNISFISPTLGASALNVMLLAGLIAFILICLFMIAYYRLPGLVACIALCGHLAGTLLIISATGFTITLPGIAGIILSIGMGVDCNVITAERIKEELVAGRTLDASIDLGFERSFAAIFDGNVTVLIVGCLLWWFGSATVLSFGFTLVLGVLFNFLMGLLASRLMLKSVSKYDIFRKRFLYRGAAVK